MIFPVEKMGHGMRPLGGTNFAGNKRTLPKGLKPKSKVRELLDTAIKPLRVVKTRLGKVKNLDMKIFGGVAATALVAACGTLGTKYVKQEFFPEETTQITGPPVLSKEMEFHNYDQIGSIGVLDSLLMYENMQKAGSVKPADSDFDHRLSKDEIEVVKKWLLAKAWETGVSQEDRKVYFYAVDNLDHFMGKQDSVPKPWTDEIKEMDKDSNGVIDLSEALAQYDEEEYLSIKRDEEDGEIYLYSMNEIIKYFEVRGGVKRGEVKQEKDTSYIGSEYEKILDVLEVEKTRIAAKLDEKMKSPLVIQYGERKPTLPTPATVTPEEKVVTEIATEKKTNLITPDKALTQVPLNAPVIIEDNHEVADDIKRVDIGE